MSTAQDTPAKANGNAPELTPEQKALAEAITYEEQIATDAAEARGEGFKELTPELFLKLWPLSRRPIPSGFIERVPKGTGKPYDSTGVRSLQVQIDRMDNTYTPLGWGWETQWQEGDKLAEVTVWVGPREQPFAIRRARGGVDRGSTAGNVAKGTETNAAKLAFGRIGPGHEVYLGAADFDPDTDPEAAEEQGKASVPPIAGIPAEQVADLVSAYEALKSGSSDADKLARDLKVKLGAMGVPTPSLNRAFAALTPTQHDEIVEWFEAQNGGQS